MDFRTSIGDILHKKRVVVYVKSSKTEQNRAKPSHYTDITEHIDAEDDG